MDGSVLSKMDLPGEMLLTTERNKKWARVLIPICAVHLLISILHLNKGHEWGDDFASYVMQAEAIVEGTMDEFMSRNDFAMAESSLRTGPVAYPWAYPLSLSIPYISYGLDPLRLKLVSVFYYQGFLICTYLLLRRKMPWQQSAALTALLAINHNLLRYQNELLSDLQFLFLSTLCLLMIDRIYSENNRTSSPRKESLWLGILIGVSFFTRPNGLLLLAALAAVQIREHIISTKAHPLSIRISLLPYVGFLIPLILFVTLFPVAPSRMQYLFQTSFDIIRSNLVFNIKSFGSIFEGLYLSRGLYLGSIVLFFAGIASLRKEVHLLVYAFLTFGLFTIWYAPQGLRFLLPIVPIYFCFVGLGVIRLTGWLPAATVGIRIVEYVALALIALVFLRNDLKLASYNLAAMKEVEGPFDRQSKEMFEYVRWNTSPNDILVFFKPRAMRMMTDRDSILLRQCTELKKADFVITHKTMNNYQQIPIDQISRCPFVESPFLFDNEKFRVFRINKRGRDNAVTIR